MTEDRHDPAVSTPAFSRDLVRRAPREVPPSILARDLEDPLTRRALVDAYLAQRRNLRSQTRVFVTLGLGALAAAVAHLVPLPYAGAGALALALATVALGVASLRQRGRRRRGTQIGDGVLVGHLDRAIFNAGDRWERMSADEQRTHLEQDLRLLGDEGGPQGR